MEDIIEIDNHDPEVNADYDEEERALDSKSKKGEF